ncbi:MAG: beta-1,6-N-acetylglucosaminyltransferase [Weeksellaceae bacterium]|nr:beta-1,6-N-acetylglucosaminyltransferase [Bacteroidota bacterium]MCG2781604.1 beta-1,6-N-acetylglucosaminyltransferase [Weeksellaceae bacterium]
MKVYKNYLILAHHAPNQLQRLIERLQDGESAFFVHVDLKSDISSFTAVISEENVTFIDKRVDCIWADFSQVQATINLIEVVATSGKRGITILLSGQDYPIKSTKYINQYLSVNDTNFFSFLHHRLNPDMVVYRERIKLFKINLSSKRDDFIIIGNPLLMSLNNYRRCFKSILRGKFKLGYLTYLFRKREVFFPIYGKGSQWFALQHADMLRMHNYISLNKNALFNFFKDSFCADEIFFHSIILNLDIRCERNNLHYINWEKKDVPLPLTFTFQDIHYFSKVEPNKLFARKFDEENSEVMDWVDKNLIV